MTIYSCVRCGFLIDIDDFQFSEGDEEWKCQNCDRNYLLEVPNFDGLLEQLGYYPANK